MKNFLASSIIFFAAFGIMAMEKDNTWNNFITRAECGLQIANSTGLETHERHGSNCIKQIIISHTVTNSGEPELTVRLIQENHMNNNGWADIGYHYCLAQDGKCFEGRDTKYVPCLIKGKNAGTCAIGIIGSFHEEGKNDVSEDNVKDWAYHIAHIAHKIGFKELKRGENILGMSDASEKYPVSPGIKVMKRFDDIIKQANEILKTLY